MYECPIETQITGIDLMIREEYNKQVLRAVQNIGIDIDKEGLLEALNHDKKRYEEAYQKGWNDCQEHYTETLKRCVELIKTLTNKE